MLDIYSQEVFNMCIMKLLSFSLEDPSGPDQITARFGVLTGDGSGVIDLTARLSEVADLGDLVISGRLEEVRTFLEEPADHAEADVFYRRLLPWPRKIFCIGVNYGGRADEYDDNSDAAFPSVFPRFPDGFTGHGQPLVRPPESPQLDYEGEIVAVIGVGGRRIPVAEARSHLAGLTLGNEGTIRDWVRHAKFNVTQGKNWMSSGSFGPHLVTMEEIPAFDELRITTHVNGELRQDDSPRTMKYSIEYQIHYLSTFTYLRPGDIIFSGTPTGAGARFDPPKWLVPGDVVEVSVPELGTLRNTVADAFPEGSDYAVPAPQ